MVKKKNLTMSTQGFWTYANMSFFVYSFWIHYQYELNLPKKKVHHEQEFTTLLY